MPAYSEAERKWIELAQHEVLVLLKKEPLNKIVEDNPPGGGGDPKNLPLIPSSPYKGLKRFNAKDKDLFFGRDRLINQLIEAVNQSNLVVVLGASGSGKSSVIRAGVLPQLSLLQGDRLQSLLFTPNRDPFESIYLSLRNQEKDYDFSERDVEIVREGKKDTLIKTAELLKSKHPQWLIFIDQFEELFTICSSQEKRTNFIQGMNSIARSGDKSVKLILAMRSDFLEQLSPYPKFARIATKNINLIADMQPDQLRQAIKQPADKHGVVFESGLVEEIIRDVLGQAGSLPLLQYTLDLLWKDDDLSDRTLNIETYRRLGGVSGALQKHVNEIYHNLPAEQQLATKQIFLRLVDVIDLERSAVLRTAVSKRAYKSEFTKTQAETVELLVNKSLLISNAPNQEGQSTIEITHEALLTSWAELKDWISDARNIISINNRLQEDANRWQQLKKENSPKANDELWSGSKLEKVFELRKDRIFDLVLDGLSPNANNFIDASIDWRDQQQYKKSVRIATFSIVGTILMGFAGWQWQQGILAKIQSITQSSTTLLANNQQIDALVNALQAGEILKPMVLPNVNAQNQVQLALQQAIFQGNERNRLEGHKDSVKSVSFSPNGKMIATASEDYTVRLWSAEGKELHKFTVQNQLFRNVTFNTDGTMIAAISADNTIKVWGIDGQEVKTVDGQNNQDNEENDLSGICFVPKTNIIAASGSDNTVKLWRISGKKLQFIKTLKGHTETVWSISCSKDGKIVTADRGGFLGLWNSDGKELRKPFQASEQSIFGVNFSPDGKTIATAGGDSTVRLWSLNGQELRTLGRHNNFVTSVSFSPDGKTIASTSGDKTVKLWSLNGQELKTLEGHGSLVSIASFSPDGKMLASSSDDNTVKLWSIEDQEPKTFLGHRDSLWSVSFSPDGTIASAGDGESKKNTDTITLWNSNGQRLISFKANSDSPWNRIWSVSFSPQGQTIATANYDKTIVLWNLKGQKLRILTGHSDQVINVNFSPKDSILASASFDGTVKLWDIKDARCIRTFEGKAGKVRSVSFSPDGKIIASAHNNGTIKLWNLEGQELATFKGHSAYITDVRFSPDGQIIASASKDKIIQLWSLKGRKLKTLKGHTGEVTRLSFRHDSKILASASADGTIRLWNLANGQEIKTLKRKGLGYPFWNVSFSPDGKEVVSVSDDALVELWNAETQDYQQLISQGCTWLRDYFNNNLKAEKHICEGIQ